MPIPVSATSSSIDRARLELELARRDRQAAAGRHRVARVHREVDDHLLDLAGVDAHRRRARARAGARARRARRAGGAAASRLVEHLVEVERPRLQHLPAPEREQLARELRRRARRRGGSRRDRGASSSFAVRALEQQRRVAGDRGEEVVEVVGDPAGEPADALELLRAQELGLEPLPLGDVAEVEDVQAGEEVRADRALDLSHGAVRALDAAVLDRDVVRAERGPALARASRARSVGTKSSSLRPSRSLLCDPEAARSRRIDVHEVPAVVHDDDRVERRLEDRAQLLLVLPQRRLRALARRIAAATRLAARRSASRSRWPSIRARRRNRRSR